MEIYGGYVHFCGWIKYIVVDYWGMPTSSAIPALHGKVSSTVVAGGMITAGSRDGVQSQIWLQVLHY